jgi:hypothetical protein
MKTFYKSIFVLFFILTADKIDCFATPQTGDLLIIETDTITIFQYPLDQYFNKGNLYNPGYFDEYIRTSCWRGYRAIWIIKDNKLFLKDIYDCGLSKNISIDRIGLKKNNEELIFANWFSGYFKINKKTKEGIKRPWDFGRIFMRKLIIKISKGDVQIGKNHHTKRTIGSVKNNGL